MTLLTEALPNSAIVSIGHRQASKSSIPAH